MSWLRKLSEAFCPKCNWEMFGQDCSNPNCEGASDGGLMDSPQQELPQKLPSDALYDQVGEERPSLGDQIHEQEGVWLYPFNQVKQDAEQGWYLDWFDEPGSISDLSKVNPGDKVADKALNLTPYWEISYVDENSGRIYVNPIEPNPFVSGVGAGGKEIGEHDMSVHSGEYEKERVDGVLKDISEGRYANPKDIAYILSGTVPTNMGPNGAQGGWYNLMDLHSTRGGQQGMTVEEIMMQDAASLQKLGLAVPQSALDGTLPPNLFSYVIDGGLPYREEEAAQLSLPGEDFQDINAMAHFILTHPQPSIKMRNWEALSRMYYAAVPYNDKPRNPELAQQIAAVVKPVAEQMSKMYHQRQQQFGDYDQYEYLKEQVIHFAQRQGWMDIVQSFEKSLDPDTRKTVLNSYAEAGMTDDIYRLLMEETNPKPLYAGLYTLYKAGLKSNDIIDADPQKYLSILSHMNEDTFEGYYAKELANAPIWLQNKDGEEGGEWIAREQGTLTTVEKYLNPSRQAATSNWLQKIAQQYSTGTEGSLYHGTNKKFQSFDLSFAGARDWGDYGVGVYLSTSPELAVTYAHEAVKNNGGGVPVVYVVQANLSNVATFDQLMEGIRSVGSPEQKDTSYVLDSGMQSRPEADSRQITEHMTSLGFDAAKVGIQVCVYDSSLLSIKREVSIEDAQWLP